MSDTISNHAISISRNGMSSSWRGYWCKIYWLYECCDQLKNIEKTHYLRECMGHRDKKIKLRFLGISQFNKNIKWYQMAKVHTPFSFFHFRFLKLICSRFVKCDVFALLIFNICMLLEMGRKSLNHTSRFTFSTDNSICASHYISVSAILQESCKHIINPNIVLIVMNS